MKMNEVTAEYLEFVEKQELKFHTEIDCPCGNGHFVVRKGHSRFLGCSDYPRCKNTTKIMTKEETVVPLAGINRIIMKKEVNDDLEFENVLDNINDIDFGIYCKDDMW